MRFYILVLIFLFFLSCNDTSPVDKNLKKVLSDTSQVQRGNIVKIDKSNYRFDYYDPYEKDSHVEYLTTKGFQGGGPSWLGIIYGGLKMSDPRILNNIRFDDESDGLAIWASNKDNLEKIGRLVAVIKKDTILMEKAIKIAKSNWKME